MGKKNFMGMPGIIIFIVTCCFTPWAQRKVVHDVGVIRVSGKRNI